jgi:hypothetical protein
MGFISSKLTQTGNRLCVDVKEEQLRVSFSRKEGGLSAAEDRRRKAEGGKRKAYWSLIIGHCSFVILLLMAIVAVVVAACRDGNSRRMPRWE